MDLTPALDRDGSVPLYMQLYRYIRKQIEAGALADGDKLPSIRRLASHLGISKQTVETVYQQLLAEGYAESRPRSGLYIMPAWQQPVTGESPSGAMEAGRDPSGTSGSGADRGGTAGNGQTRPVRYDFRYGDVDAGIFPVGMLRRCMNEALLSSSETLGYGDPQGEPELRGQIAAYLRRSRGVDCEPEQLFLFAGTQQAVGFLCRHLPLAGRLVAMEEPGYDGVRVMFRLHGCPIAPIPLEEDGIDVKRLRDSGAGAVYVTPSHQFPMGMVLPVQKRMQLLQWAAERDGYIIEDDYDSEFRYQGQPIPALKSLDRNERVIYAGTFSKCLFPAARLSYAVVPPHLAARFRANAGGESQSVSPLMQKALFLFMKEGYFDRHIRRMRRLYQLKHQAVLRAVRRHMGERVEAADYNAGLHMILLVKDRDYGELEKLAAHNGVRIYSPLKHWAEPDPSVRSSVMLGFGGVKEQDIEPGIRLLAEAWFGRR
ncbi:PLP-dependent aminotransferase family protein [Paenibacillus thailandensis]|uniref:PLP-dependent aminotransferase family protein n=1 Tax=Paenibacillus thailandensis TaxID=393250 RepID=A0ABW5R5C7_9BACL